MGEKIEVENVNHPGQLSRVDAARYQAVKAAMLSVLPEGAPGISAAEMKDRMRPRLEEMFPGGEKLGWWQKTVQLDLEAKGLVQRQTTKPLTFFRAP